MGRPFSILRSGTWHANRFPRGPVLRWSLALGLALAAHGLLSLMLGRDGAALPSPVPEAVQVLLVPTLRHERPPASPAMPSPRTGGGAPASPSVIHPPPQPPPEVERELIAPAQPAPQAEALVGIAPLASPEPGQGLDGQGTGTGSGTGAGHGPGSGSAPARLVSGPSLEQIRARHPPGARRRYGRVEMSCVIRLDERLEACRVVSETPEGLGFGAAGLELVSLFRFRPPRENGRSLAGQRIVVGVDFGRPR